MAASSGELGSVEFAVQLDGREVVRTGPIGRSSEPLRISNLDVSDVETMTLTVDFGRNGDVLDRATGVTRFLCESVRRQNELLALTSCSMAYMITLIAILSASCGT